MPRFQTVLAAVALIVGFETFGAAVTVRTKAELLDAVVEASDGEGRLRRDLDIVFARDCEKMNVSTRELSGESDGRSLDCAGRRIRLDAAACPYETVTIAGGPVAGGTDSDFDAITGCGAGSRFRNLVFASAGRLVFASAEDTLVEDCDFVNAGPRDLFPSEPGGAIRGCGTVDGCAFEGCRATAGGALSECEYVSACVFLECCASDRGGAIYGGGDVVACLFVDCSSQFGGAVMSGDRSNGFHPKVVQCTFVRCADLSSGAAVYENPENLPVFMLNDIFYGCGRWQEGSDLKEKFGCYQLTDVTFFADYEQGDFHPYPYLDSNWEDPCGLKFGDVVEGVGTFVCRDLDGWGYQLSSPWPNCPGCYRFRTDYAMEEPVRPSASHVVEPRKKGGVKKVKRHSPSKTKASSVVSGGWHSVRNRPPEAVSVPVGTKLLDLSKLPLTVTQNEIPHEGDNPLDFLEPWYAMFERREALGMPEFGVDPGYGCPGEITPYADDDELKGLMGRYGFRSGWYHRGFPQKGTPAYSVYRRRLEYYEAGTNETLTCDTCAVEKIPFLFSQAPSVGKAPLVVYIAGSGEQGTDLKKMFRQTGVFDAVREPGFLAARPCHLLAIMPPEFANWNAFIHYPHSYGYCLTGYREGDRACCCAHRTGSMDLIRMYADLIFALRRELEAKGAGTIDPDAIVLVGLGSGSTAAVSMMREYPGRYAGTCATYPSFFRPSVNPYRPGRWWYALSESYHGHADDIEKMLTACREANADVRLTRYPDGENWWNRQYSSPEFKEWLVHCFEAGPLHGREFVVARSNPTKDLLLAKTGPQEVTYYGTAAERPQGLPKEVAKDRVKDLKGVRYLRVEGHVGEIPMEAFRGSADLETVLFEEYLIPQDERHSLVECALTNIAARAFADSPKLKLIIFERDDPRIRIAHDAFAGCSPTLYGGTRGIPITNGKMALDALILPMDGLCDHHVFIADDLNGRPLYIDNDFIWSPESDGANALMYIGDRRDVFVPETLGGLPVTAIGRHLLHREGGFEYGLLALPATVKRSGLYDFAKFKALFAAGALPEMTYTALRPDTVVYGTTPEEESGHLVPHYGFWNGKEVVVPKGTDPHGLSGFATVP